MHPSYAVCIWLLYMLPAARERVRSVCYKVTGRCFNVTGSDSEEGENMENGKLLSEKTVGLKPSGIRKFFDLVSEMKDAISLGVGEPDFDTPWHIRDEGIYSLEKGRTFYTSNSGLKELRQEICAYMKRTQDIDYVWDKEVLITIQKAIFVQCLAKGIGYLIYRKFSPTSSKSRFSQFDIGVQNLREIGNCLPE